MSQACPQHMLLQGAPYLSTYSDDSLAVLSIAYINGSRPSRNSQDGNFYVKVTLYGFRVHLSVLFSIKRIIDSGWFFYYLI